MGFSRSVIIITGSLSNLGSIVSTFRELSYGGWIYCGKDVPFGLELDNALGTDAKVEIGQDLQDTAREFRQEYIDFIGGMSRSVSSEALAGRWWLSSVSEKNPFISDVYLYFCYLETCRRICSSENRDLIIVSESSYLSDALRENLTSLENTVVTVAGSCSVTLPEKIRAYSLPSAKKMWFIGTFFFRIFLARLYCHHPIVRRNRPSEPPGICLHAFTDDRSLSQADHYHHIYFRGLGPDLERANHPYFNLIDVLPTTSYLTAIRRILRYPEHCYLLEEFITIPDILRALWFVHSSGRFWNSGTTLAGIQMDRILDGEVKRDGSNTRREEARLRFYAGKRLSSQAHIRTFVYIFENHIWEKMFCQAFRRYSPATILIGYAHSIVNTLYTCYSVSSLEEDLLPGPDIIAVNGIRAKFVLEQSGFTRARIEVTGALRYQHLEKKPFMPKNHEKKMLLVALSAGINDSLELAHKVLSAFGNDRRVSIILKCHPTLPFRLIASFLFPLPENACIKDEPVEILIRDADICFYSESTVCVEALAMGVPIVNVRSDHHVDMNIFEGIEGVPSVSTMEELQEVICSVRSEEALQQFNTLQPLVEDIFSPVNAGYQEVFSQRAESGSNNTMPQL